MSVARTGDFAIRNVCMRASIAPAPVRMRARHGAAAGLGSVFDLSGPGPARSGHRRSDRSEMPPDAGKSCAYTTGVDLDKATAAGIKHPAARGPHTISGSAELPRRLARRSKERRGTNSESKCHGLTGYGTATSNADRCCPVAN